MATINTEYFDNLISQVNNISSCPDLDEVKNAINKQKQAILDDIVNQLELLAPLVSLGGGELGDVIHYINNLIKTFEKPYLDLISLQAQYIAKFAELSSAINNKIDTLNCDITLLP